MPSFVWGYFSKISLDTAQCNFQRCGKTFKWKKGVSALGSHLKTYHNIFDPKYQKDTASPVPPPTNWQLNSKAQRQFDCYNGRTILPHATINNLAGNSSTTRATRSFVEVEQDESSGDDFSVRIPDDPINCFICGEDFGHRRAIQLTNILSSTGTHLYKVLESFFNLELSVETKNSSAVCQECFINLEKYDCFQKKSNDIQKKITAAYFKSQNEPVFIKQESRSNLPETVLVNAFDYTSNFEDSQYEVSRLDPDASEDDEEEPRQAQTAVDRKVFQCYKCGKRCISQHATRSHLITEHSRAENSFECSICFKVMTDKVSMQRHFNSHQKRKFLCMQCGKVLANENYYKRHLMSHGEARPCKCTFEGCGKSFKTRENLRIHSRVHTGEKKYECPYCPGKRFAQFWGRQKHLNSHHKKEPSKSAEECM